MASTVNESIETQLFINGEFRASSSNKAFEVVYPYTKEVVAQGRGGCRYRCQHSLPRLARSGHRQARRIPTQTISALLESNNELAKLETLCTGRPVSQFVDAGLAAESFAYFAGGGWTAQGTASLNTPDHLNLTVKQPYGVVALIIPWNFPLIILPGKWRQRWQQASLYVAKLIEKAGFPPGVVNIISGFGNPTGAALASHMAVRCISFTGSTVTGQKIQEAAAKSSMKHVHMELGGKSPAIFFEDADLETAVAQTQFGIQFNSGQVCAANSRIYVHESVAKQFIKLFCEKFAAVQMGDPLDPATSHGPQIDLLQYNWIKEYLAIGKKDGTLRLGGDANDGFFVRPTIFEGVGEDLRLMRAEVFGPVVVINTFFTETEAIEKANNSEFGLYAAVFTKDLDRAVRLAKALDAGTVGVNCTSPTNARDTAFGG
ncbi:hypothetical protein N7519_002473 [Penicillium mononematosum]|uniref:uncharacterized protein n=1 Tax=Penicillium mononematosum TaxID=268346 RepID=UPI002549998D|nr:uncharacterized protein N7519_002473 [Penicillium mononematosum]KAJ6187565.1 hypothetical protein N7519_002473 [Penicillium mononematosum]